jgi:hypothetical protein
MEALPESPNPSQVYARKRPHESSGLEEGVIDLTRGKLKSKKLSLSKSKACPSPRSTGHQPPDSDDDFQVPVYVNRGGNSDATLASVSSSARNIYRSDSDDSFSDVFPIPAELVRITKHIFNC